MAAAQALDRRRDALEQLGSEVGDGREAGTVRVDELGCAPEPKRGPAVLVVEPAVGGPEPPGRSLATSAWISDVSAMVTRKAGRLVGMRTSSVPRRGWGRTSHQMRV